MFLSKGLLMMFNLSVLLDAMKKYPAMLVCMIMLDLVVATGMLVIVFDKFAESAEVHARTSHVDATLEKYSVTGKNIIEKQAKFDRVITELKAGQQEIRVNNGVIGNEFKHIHEKLEDTSDAQIEMNTLLRELIIKVSGGFSAVTPATNQSLAFGSHNPNT